MRSYSAVALIKLYSLCAQQLNASFGVYVLPPTSDQPHACWGMQG